MRVRKIILVIITLTLSSCNFLDFKIKNRAHIANEQLNEIKLQGLETYPLLNDCNSETLENSKLCFEEQLTTHINTYFSKDSIIDNLSVKQDTIWVAIFVSEKGNLSLSADKKSDQVSNFEIIKDKLEASLRDISPIKPAYIQGKPVGCVFKLPLTISN